MPTWIPSFLNWQTGLIAAGIVIPSLLVLYFLKLRRREMAVSSTLLWKKAIQDLQVNSPFQRLRRNLLLLLQMLLLMLLLLALSRPVANYTPGVGAMSVLLIDRSASMLAKDIDGGKRTRLDEAKRRAKDLVDSMKRGSTAMVIAFDDSSEMVQTLTGDSMALKRAIDSIQPTHRRTRVKMGYQLAEAQMYFDPAQNRASMAPPDIRVFTDGRLLDDPTDLSVQGKVTYERVGTETAGNVAIVALSAKRNYEDPLKVQVFARLANYGPEPVETFVEFTVDKEKLNTGGGGGGAGGAAGGARRLSKLLLLPERWTDEQRVKWQDENKGAAPSDSVEQPLELTEAAVIKVEQMHKDGDVLAADDVASVVVPPPKSLAVLLVTDGDNYFLEKAVTSLNLKDPVIIDPATYEDKKPTDFDVVMFDRYVPLNPDREKAGAFVYFGAVPTGLKLKAAKNEAGQYAIIDDMWVLDWRRDHPILKDLAMNKLYVGEAIKLDVPLDSEVLLDGMKCPLIVLHREGKQTHLVVAFNVLQSNWPLKVSFPIFLHHALQFMAVGSEMDVRQSLAPGATPRIPRFYLQKAGGEDGEVPKQVTLEAPDGSEKQLTVPAAGDFALPAMDFVGVYRTDPPVPPFDRMAVNLLDGNESNVLPLPKEQFPGGAETINEGGTGKSRVELWWWVVACAALPLLLIEWWVYTRRVHL